jgi:ketosteroid isomerase-like protein
MSVTALEDLDVAIEEYHRAAGEFVKGNPEPLKMTFSHRDDVSLGNPFGPFVRGWKPVAETMDRAATNYRDGEASGFENVAMYATADIACVVEVERFMAKVGGSDVVATIALRCTTVLRPEADVWRVVHRHADPITFVRPAESIVQS